MIEHQKIIDKLYFDLFGQRINTLDVFDDKFWEI